MRKSHSSDYSAWNNRRHKILPPEEMLVNTLYTCTINPEVQPLTPQFTLDLVTWHNGMDNKFKQLKFCTLNLKVEISSGSRWHYHGTIKITDIMKFFIFDMPVLKNETALEIDKMEDKEIWAKYCCKQETIMKPICQEYGIPYNYISDQIMKVKIQPLNDNKFTSLFKLCPSSDDIED